MSPQIANFLHDPDAERNIAHAPPLIRDTFRNYAHQSIALEKGWISYCLFRLRKADEASRVDIAAHNARQMKEKQAYSEALAQMRAAGEKPYEVASAGDPGFQAPQSERKDTETVLFAPSWVVTPVAARRAIAYAARHVLLYGFESHVSAAVTRLLQGESCRVSGLDSEPDFRANAAASYERHALHLCQEIKRLIAEGRTGLQRLQVVVPADPAQEPLLALGALLKTARQEKPEIAVQIVAVESSDDAVAIARRVEENLDAIEDVIVRYREGERSVEALVELEQLESRDTFVAAVRDTCPWKAGGTYLITGGAGGLGVCFANEIAQRVREPNLVLIGRSGLDEKTTLVLDRLRAIGAKASYHQVDVSDAAAVSVIVRDIVDTHGALDGVIHSAGVLRDTFILHKREEDLREVFAPKVAGILNIDAATKLQPLDFFVMFSSLAAHFGNLGQVDYAAANAFMDRFAAQRSRLVASGDRHGRTLSINWPLWRTGGMGVDPAIEASMERATGLTPIHTSAGLVAFYCAYDQPCEQVLVFYGEARRLRDLARASAPQVQQPVTAGNVGAVSIDPDRIRGDLKGIFCRVLLLEPVDFTDETGFSELGVSSISAIALLEAINECYRLSLPTSVVFEFSSLASLGAYIKESLERAKPTAGPQPRPSAADDLPEVPREPVRAIPREGTDNRNPIPVPEVPPTPVGAGRREQAIAIVGIACRCAGAKDKREFWDLIAQGRESIREVEDPRWLRVFEQHALEYPIRYGAMEGVDYFDAAFFNISPLEAQRMDVRQRMLLEQCHEAIEDAGYAPRSLDGRDVAVIMGALQSTPTYHDASHFSTLGNENSILAARLSYFLNLKGPAIALDTACSSSLVAIDLACQKLRAREIDVALAGGANVYNHPMAFVSMYNARMLSPTGQCRPFDDGADGVVVGDAVGVLVLKRLADAERDNDHVYAVIVASGTNQDGKTAGITVPSFLAQSRLEQTVYRRGGIDVEEIQYIEAHGTATRLGDPIEVHALTDAFRHFTEQKQFCALGSVKANIGHTAAAAGVMGVIKACLSLQHGQLPPSIHCQRTNQHIDFAESPVYVNSTLKEWPVNPRGRRLAAVSSFGFSGTNAHLVLEDHRREADREVTAALAPRSPAAIVLSARSNERLRAHAAQLLSALPGAAGGERLQDGDLESLAYTLQVGRDAMEYRLGLLVSSVSELAEALRTWISNVPEGDLQVNRAKLRGDSGLTARELNLLANDITVRGNSKKTLELWLQGVEVDWAALYLGRQPRRLSLPSYPFLREVHRIEAEEASAPVSTAVASPPVHPLLHVNRSSLAEVRYTSVLRPEEFFLKDHRIGGRNVLPGVCHLEMGRAAMEAGMGLDQAPSGCRLRDVVWLRPLIVHEPTEVHISLCEDGAGATFEIHGSDAHTSEEILYAQGRMEGGLPLAPQEATLRLASLSGRADLLIDVEACYGRLRELGIEYGPAHRALKSVQLGTDASGGRFVLARLSLPQCVAHTSSAFGLHPSILDGALQAAIGLSFDDPAWSTARAKGRTLAVPFALERMDIVQATPPQAWAYVRGTMSPGGTSTPGLRKLDIDVSDETGRLCVRLTGLTSRAVEGEAEGAAAIAPNRSHSPPATLLLAPRWEARPLHGAVAANPSRNDWLVFADARLRSRMNELTDLVSPQSRVLPEVQADGEGFLQASALLFDAVRSVLESRLSGPLLLQVLLADVPGETSLLAAVAGLLRTASLENPLLIAQTVTVDLGWSAARIANALRENASVQARVDREIRYVSDVREVLRLSELSVGPEQATQPWKDRGIYLITGGGGGLGLVIAHAIATQVRGATLILACRSPLGEEQRARLEALHRNYEVESSHYSLDVTDAAAVEQCITDIIARFGALHGVLHAAGTLEDNFIITKTDAEFRQVLMPKVQGVRNLDRSTARVPLEFFLLFSSLAGPLGNIGQCDYATGNAFLDRYAGHRNELVGKGQRHGRTLSINWPLWAEGGMGRDEQTVANVRRLGFEPLATGAGLQALTSAWAGSESQVLVLAGDRERLLRLVAPQSALGGEFADGASPAVAASGGDDLERTVLFLKKSLGRVLKLRPEQIDASAGLDRYGIDSIVALRMVEELEGPFGALPKTLMFEYQSIEALAAYFMERHRATLASRLNESAQPSLRGHPDSAARGTGIARRRSRRRARDEGGREAPGTKTANTGAVDVAIIGVSGRFPQAENLEQYWRNLKEGRDCITEIPGRRWDSGRYFDPEKGKVGKTYCKWGGFMDGVDEFDPLFFNISPREAQFMDPQERLFLQCAYQTLEDAGYTREELRGNASPTGAARVGVFVGVMYTEYQLYGAQAQAHGKQFALGGSAASIANRVSYFCNFQGPSLAVDTMCSSSLTAIHLACESIRHGQCELALAGGVNVSVHPNKYLALAQGQFASSTGRCASFGDGGDGYVPGEGVGAVLLKPLARAIEDKDHIYGVIKGTAINHGGKTNGYTVPNPSAQAQVVADVVAQSGIEPGMISYVEAHGTGTSLGDPIEIAALTQAFGAGNSGRQFCSIGSVKSNIGHLESAAGIAGVAKVLLQLKHGSLVPSLHSQALNPHIDFSQTPFFVQRTVDSWQRPLIERDGERFECPRIAGISSFGAGGANAHVLIEEYSAPTDPADEAGTLSRRPALIVLSAKTEEQLRGRSQQLLDHLDGSALSEAELFDLAYTLQTGREAMDHRLAFAASTLEDVRRVLVAHLGGEVHRGQVDGCFHSEARKTREVLTSLHGDPDAVQLIAAWLDKGKHDKLLELWAKGLAYDWRQLYAEGSAYATHRPPRRISLPAYPFARERYWVFGTEDADVWSAGVSAEAAAPVASDAAQRGERVLTKTWRPAAAVEGNEKPKNVLILHTEATRSLADRLARQFAASTLIADPAGAVEQPVTEFDGWVDLIGCAARTGANEGWVALLQRWLESAWEGQRVALCVSRGLEAFRNPSVQMSGADRVGLYRMLGHEYASVRSRHVELAPETQEASAVEQIAAECMTGSGEVEVCYRDGMRYVAGLGETSLADTASGRSSSVTKLPEDQVLWITGGTRGIGYACAQHFVRHYGARRLVLTGREPFPPREEWQRHLDRRTAMADKIRSVQALEAQGAEVRILAVPLSHPQALRESVREIKETLGPICGVIHCAGVIDRETPAFIRKTPAGTRAVLEPKTTGLDHLLECLGTEPLRFFLLFSSVAAAVPALAVGQSDYAMANAYMDYTAQAFARSLPIVSIQWPSWKETGMGEVRSTVYRDLGLLSHTNAEGLRLLDRLVDGRYGAVVLPAMVNTEVWDPSKLLLRAERPNIPKSAHSSPVRAPGSPISESLLEAIRSWVTDVVSQELRIERTRLEPETPLADYGVDSIMLVQVLRPISERVGEKLDPSILFEFPSIALFSRWLAERYATLLLPPEERRSSVSASPQPSPPTPAPSAAPALSTSAGMPAAHAVSSSADIAVVGLSCRFPGARTVEEYWRLLAEGRSAIRRVTPSGVEGSPPYFAAMLDERIRFDPAFFLISEEDARAMDPQALLAMEETLSLWHHAGYSLSQIKGRAIGVYFGVRGGHAPDPAALAAAPNPILATGPNYLATNVSRFFDLRGPSMVIDTACSSALVAMSTAIQALRYGDIESAVVGGVSLLGDGTALRLFEQRGLLNDSPEFHIFDRRSKGAILGEGIGMVWLKTVDQALRDGDSIYAVVKGLAVNNDGRTAGPAAPNLQAQKEVMQAALARSGKRAEEVEYIEVNGSGTEVTDLLELKAIEAVYRPDSSVRIELGSMKPNIGHPLCAEGIASFIKCVLMLQHGRRVPFLSAREPMAHYRWEKSPFEFSRALSAAGEGPAVVAINCFADGGTNVHAILETWRERRLEAAVHKPIAPQALQRIDVRASASASNEDDFWDLCGRALTAPEASGPLKEVSP